AMLFLVLLYGVEDNPTFITKFLCRRIEVREVKVLHTGHRTSDINLLHPRKPSAIDNRNLRPVPSLSVCSVIKVSPSPRRFVIDSLYSGVLSFVIWTVLISQFIQ